MKNETGLLLRESKDIIPANHGRNNRAHLEKSIFMGYRNTRRGKYPKTHAFFRMEKPPQYLHS
jgi:hypothetical protein